MDQARRRQAHAGFESLESRIALTVDPSLSAQWALNNVGQAGGIPDADIDAFEAWQVTSGSRNVVVAIVDSGIDFSHPDLAANIWTNPREVAGNGRDDDGNGSREHSPGTVESRLVNGRHRALKVDDVAAE